MLFTNFTFFNSDNPSGFPMQPHKSKNGLHHDSFMIFSHAEDSVRYQSSLKDALATHPTLRYSRILNKRAGTLISTVEKFSTGTLI